MKGGDRMHIIVEWTLMADMAILLNENREPMIFEDSEEASAHARMSIKKPNWIVVDICRGDLAEKGDIDKLANMIKTRLDGIDQRFGKLEKQIGDLQN
jgi:hypothetical protein